VNLKGKNKEVSRGQVGLDHRDRRGAVADTSITWVWQENGYGHVMLPDTAISNAMILNQSGNKKTPSAPPAHSAAPQLHCMPPPDNLNRFFQVQPALMSLWDPCSGVKVLLF
jgi:hypothetical protein